MLAQTSATTVATTSIAAARVSLPYRRTARWKMLSLGSSLTAMTTASPCQARS
jgi:hypothetical protein